MMNIYSVYIGASEKKKELLVIKQGFCFIAGLFNVLWAIYHRMWAVVGAMLIISILSSYFIPSHIVFYLDVVTLLAFSFFASDLREFYASKRGGKLIDIILANNEEEAEVKYFERTNHINFE